MQLTHSHKIVHKVSLGLVGTRVGKVLQRVNSEPICLPKASSLKHMVVSFQTHINHTHTNAHVVVTSYSIDDVANDKNDEHDLLEYGRPHQLYHHKAKTNGKLQIQYVYTTI